LKLERRGAGAETLIDDLTFTYNGNRLLTVTDSKNNSGFADGNKEGEDYKYDENGNMVVDHNKEVSAITYNHLNLPVTVTKKNGETLTFTYDGAGKKLTQTTTTANGTFVLDYAGSAVYHNNQPAYLNHEEGRVILGDEISYEYFLRDHLGNTRLAFTTKREQETSTATLDNPEQDQTFLRYDNVRRVRDKLFDHTFDPTDGDGFAVRLTGGEAEKTGLAKSVEIMPGDKVHMEVYGKYVHPNDRANWAGVLTNLIDLIASGVNGSVLVDGVKYGSSDNSLPIPDREPEPIPDGEYSGPPAYLNYVFIPIDGNLDRVQFDVRKLSAAPRENGSDVDHEKLELDFTATETGLLYVYLSNDNEQPVEEVFFDDFSVTHIKSPIIQHTSYYPFGLAFDSYQREHTISQRSKFQGQEHIDDLGLDWDAFKWRNHQPEIGRFFNVDPLAEKFPYNSPYAFSENKITNSIELEGLEQVPANEIWDIHVVPVHSIGMLSSYFYTAVIGDYYYELFEITSGPNKGNFYARSYLGRDENNNRVYQWDYVIGKDRIDEVKGKKTETLDVGGSKYNAYAQAIFFGAFDYNSYENPSFENLKIGKWIYDQWTTPENYVFGASMWVSTLRAYTKSSLRLGRQMHEAYKVGQTGLKEFRLPSGKRIDFLDVQNGIIYELKPYNPRAMQQGQQQLQTYLRELQSPETLRLYPEFRGIQWRTVLDTY
ncbi:MAG TPA: RHS repeat-associated core domain-containing protein, partial [Chryseosolibacter sp.]|nr:RHS repeat-associated core domain-containing protein [Chryseosolibacter sp.]